MHLGLRPTPPCRYLKPDGSESVVLTGGDSPVEYIRQRGGPLSTCPWHSLQARARLLYKEHDDVDAWGSC